MYRFDFTENGGKYPGYAYHGLELGMVWGKPHTEVMNADAESDLGKKVHSAWVAFLRGDAPSGPGLPRWPQYASSSRSTLIIDTDSRVEQLPQENELRLWDGVI
jgi:para-nitrobenzyl esterase